MTATSLSRTMSLSALLAALFLGLAAPQAHAGENAPAASAKPKPRPSSGELRDPVQRGEWIADVERPAEQFRGRYGLRLADARAVSG
jgi:hypothetical protein